MRIPWSNIFFILHFRFSYIFFLNQLHINSVRCRFLNIFWHNLFNNWIWGRSYLHQYWCLCSITTSEFLFPFSLPFSKTTNIDTCSEVERFQAIHWNNCQIISVHFTANQFYSFHTQLWRWDVLLLWLPPPTVVNAKWLLSQSRSIKPATHHVSLYKSTVTHEFDPFDYPSSRDE